VLLKEVFEGYSASRGWTECPGESSFALEEEGTRSKILGHQQFLLTCKDVATGRRNLACSLSNKRP